MAMKPPGMKKDAKPSGAKSGGGKGGKMPMKPFGKGSKPSC